MTIKEMFWNGDETRIRAGWRVIIQFSLMIVFLLLLINFDKWLLRFLPVCPLSSKQTLLAPLAFFFATLSSVWLCARYLDRRPLKALGLSWDRAWYQDFTAGLLLGIALNVIIFMVLKLSGWISVTGILHSDSQVPALHLILYGLVTHALVGFHEELHSRGYLLKNIAEGMKIGRSSPEKAILISYVIISVFFGVMHAGNPGASFVSTFCVTLIGFCWGLPYILTGRLGLSIGLHMTWNFTQACVFGFPVSGISIGGSIIAVKLHGPVLWTGGAFGPEAGLAGLIANVIGIGLILLWVKKRGGVIRLNTSLAEYK